MKNKYRITAIALATVTGASVLGSGMTTAFAASDNAAVSSDTGIAAANGAVDKLIEVVCDCNPAMKILGAAGIGVVDSLFGTLYDTGMSMGDLDDHITRSTDEIVRDINSLHTDMTTYHNEEMAALSDLSAKLDKEDLKRSLDNFNYEDKQAQSAHNDFMDSITNHAGYINNNFVNDQYKVIDENTYNAFCEIIKDQRVATEFSNMKVYLDEKGGTFALLSKLEKDDYESVIDKQLTADRQGVHTVSQLQQLASYSDVINDIKGHMSDMTLYYVDCLQLSQMKYDVRNYEAYQKYANDPAKLDDQLSRSTAQLESEANTYYNNLKTVSTAYHKSMYPLKKANAADITMTVNGKTYAFSVENAMKGWFVMNTMTDCFRDRSDRTSVTDITFTLNKDWVTTDSNLGFYPDATYKSIVESLPQAGDDDNHRQAYLMLPQDYAGGSFYCLDPINFTLNLNGHSIKAPDSDKVMFKYDADTFRGLNMTINGDDQRSSTIDNAAFYAITRSNNLDLTINNVTLNQRGDHYMFFAYGNGDAHINHCTGTNEKADLHSADTGYWGNTGREMDKWTFSYDFNDCSFA